MNHFAVHLKLIQHCKSQYKIKKFFKLLEENTDKSFHQTGFGDNFLNMTPK